MSVKLTRRALVITLPLLGLVACGGSTESTSGVSAATSGESAAGVRTDAGYQLNAVTDGAPTVTLYTDLQCPYCAKADPKYREAAAELEGTMNVTVRHFPLFKSYT